MYPTNVMTVFCEDIREEKNETFTLIGVLPDTMNVSAPSDGDKAGTSIVDPSVRPLTKLCVYTRVHFDPKKDIGEPSFRLILPNDQTVNLGLVEAAMIKKARDEAIANGNILAGVVGRAVLGGFQLPKLGVLKLEVDIGGKTYLGGSLNFREAPTSPTAH